MEHTHRPKDRLMIVIAVVFMLLAALLPTARVQAAAPPIIATLEATDDARTQQGSPT